MTERGHDGGGLTEATGYLTPAESDEAFDPGERREIEDAGHQADVTIAQARVTDHERPSDADDNGPTPVQGPRVGGDTVADHEEHF